MISCFTISFLNGLLLCFPWKLFFSVISTQQQYWFVVLANWLFLKPSCTTSRLVNDTFFDDKLFFWPGIGFLSIGSYYGNPLMSTRQNVQQPVSRVWTRWINKNVKKRRKRKKRFMWKKEEAIKEIEKKSISFFRTKRRQKSRVCAAAAAAGKGKNPIEQFKSQQHSQVI